MRGIVKLCELLVRGGRLHDASLVCREGPHVIYVYGEPTMLVIVRGVYTHTVTNKNKS